MGEKHFVTGANGMLGKVLVKRLLDEGASVSAYDLVFDEDFPAGAERVHGDIRDAHAIRDAMSGCQIVHHLAARGHQARLGMRELADINVGGTKQVLEAALDQGIRRLVFASTVEMYGPQTEFPVLEDGKKLFTGDYSRTKFECERILYAARMERGIEVTCLRMPIIFGEAVRGAMPFMFDMVRRNLPVVMAFNQHAPFAYVSARDTAQAFALAARVPAADGESFNVATAAVPPIREVLRGFIASVGSKSRLVPVPLMALKIFIRLWMLTGRPLPFVRLPAEILAFSLTGGHYGIEKAQRVLGYAPQDDCVQCLRRTYEWYGGDRRRSFATTIPKREIAN